MKRLLFSRQFSYVSKHYSITPEEFKNVISSIGSDVRSGSDGKVEVKVCKLCNKGNKTNMDNLWKLCINKDGSYHCFRCAQHGNYFDLKTKISGGSNMHQYVKPQDKEVSMISNQSPTFDSSNKINLESNPSLSENSEKVLPDQAKSFGLTKALFDCEIDDDELVSVSFLENKPISNMSMNRRAGDVRQYLTNVRKLSLKICQKYGVGVDVQDFAADSGSQWESHTCITFPWIIPTKVTKDSNIASNPNTIIRIKYR